MRRPSNVQATRDLIAELRRVMPDIALRTTFIVGYPGETEEEFQTLLDFMREIEFDRAGVFAYSREEGTPAAALEGQVPTKVKKERVERAMLAQREISLRRHQSLVGKVLSALIEGEGHTLSPIDHRRHRSKQSSERLLVGRSYRDAPEIDGLVLCRGDGRPGDLIPVKITEALPYDLAGEVVKENVSRTGAKAR
jgi:ribosomal protein S12 methylthiotransferase